MGALKNQAHQVAVMQQLWRAYARVLLEVDGARKPAPIMDPESIGTKSGVLGIHSMHAQKRNPHPPGPRRTDLPPSLPQHARASLKRCSMGRVWSDAPQLPHAMRQPAAAVRERGSHHAHTLKRQLRQRAYPFTVATILSVLSVWGEATKAAGEAEREEGAMMRRRIAKGVHKGASLEGREDEYKRETRGEERDL